MTGSCTRNSVSCPVPHGVRTFALRIKDNSMEPDYSKGDIIYIDPDEQVEHDKDILVGVPEDQGHVMRRLKVTDKQKILVALNQRTRQPAIVMTRKFKVCGVVICSARPR